MPAPVARLEGVAEPGRRYTAPPPNVSVPLPNGGVTADDGPDCTVKVMVSETPSASENARKWPRSIDDDVVAHTVVSMVCLTNCGTAA